MVPLLEHGTALPKGRINSRGIVKRRGEAALIAVRRNSTIDDQFGLDLIADFDKAGGEDGCEASGP